MKNILVKIIVVFIALFSVISFTACKKENNNPEPPTHDHVKCTECGKCTDKDCPGTNAEKCSCPPPSLGDNEKD